MAKKKIWISDGRMEDAEAYAELLREDRPDYAIEIVPVSQILARLENVAAIKEDAPHLLITNLLGGDRIDGKTPIGESIMAKMKELELNNLPLTVITGDMSATYRKFPGTKVQVLPKPEAWSNIVSHIDGRLAEWEIKA